MTPKPPPGFELVGAASRPEPPPGFQLVPVSQEPKQTQEPSWWQRNITGVRPQGEEQTPNVYDVEDFRSLGNVGSIVAGASDKQLADQIKGQLGKRFIRQDQDENGYPIMVWRGEDGQERRGYVNNPGLDRRDIARAIAGAIPYAASGGGAAAVGVGRGLLSNSLLQGLAAGTTSVAGDVAQIPLGSEQGIEGEKAAAAATFGAAGPIVGRGIANASEYIANQFINMPDALQPFRRNAVNRVLQSVEADQLTPQIAQQRMAALGREGMLADIGQNLQAQTAALARTQGRNRQIVTQALDVRAHMAPHRINRDLNRNLGVPQNLRDTERAIRQNYGAQAAPLYQQFYQSRIPQTQQLTGIVDTLRSELPSVFREATRLARLDGHNPRVLVNLVDDPMTAMTGVQRTQGQRVWQGVELDYLKRAVDDLVENAAPGTNEERILSNTARELRNTVDNLLSPNDPTQSVWAQARAIAGEGIQARQALQRGFDARTQRGIFSRTEDPAQLRADMAGMSQEAQEMLRAGARADLRATAGRAATAYGPNGDTRLRRALNSDFNRQNMGIVAPSQNAANNILRRIDAETAFAATNDLAQRNSVTSTMQAAQRTIPGAREAEMNFASEAGKKGPVGLATEYAARLADMLAGGAIGNRNEAIRTDMARMLVEQGGGRDRIAHALFGIQGNRAANREQAAQIERIIRALGIAGTGPAAAATAD